MARRKGFSWKRATGLTKAKRKISRATGIPVTKSGRKQKLKRMTSFNLKNISGKGCSSILLIVLFFVTTFILTSLKINKIIDN